MIILDQDRLESLEREMASLKGQVNQAFVSPSTESDINRSFTAKKSQVAARVTSPIRVPVPFNNRKLTNEDIPIVSTNDGPFSRPLPIVNRSRSFNNGSQNPPSSPPSNGFEESNLLRSYKIHLEQILRKDAPPFSDIKIPNYTSIDDVMKSNEVEI